MTRASYRMRQRNLVYTAITRAKSKLILLGELAAFDYAVTHTGTARKTYLKERFAPVTALPEQAEQTPTASVNYRLTEENYRTIEPMIGLTQADIEQFF